MNASAASGAIPESEQRLRAEKHLLGRWLAQARRQGLLAAVPPEAWHTLCAVLSFTCRDGERRFTPEQLALSLAVPREEAERRLLALASVQWQGQPLAEPARYPDGALGGARVGPSDLLLGVNEAAEPQPAPPRRDGGPRAGAAAPRPDGALKERLLAVGLLPDQAERLLTHFPEERIARQLAWLPRRGARNPAAFLLKAVANDWPAPKEAP